MLDLQVEELESRRVLNSTGPQLPLVQFSAAITEVFVVVERSPFLDYAGHGGTFGWRWWGEGERANGPFRAFARFGFEGGDLPPPGAHAPGRQSPGAGLPETWAGRAFWAGADPPDAGPGAGGSDASRINTGRMPPAPSGSVSSSRAVNGASAEAFFAMATPQPNPQLLPGLENPMGARVLPIEAQGLSAVRSSLWVVREGGGSGSAGNLGPGNGQQLQGSGMSASAQADQESALPSPQVSQMLAVLPAFDLQALEVGMEQFLKELGSLGPRLAMDMEGMRLWPWIVALAAAATACEIARPELRRPAGVPAVETSGISPWSSDHLLEDRS